MFLRSLRVGSFLARRQLKRSNIWSTTLITFIMTLTFLNLTVVPGILVGLIAGSSLAYRTQFSADAMISTLPSKREIGFSTDILATLKSMPEVVAVTPRYLLGTRVQSNYNDWVRQTDVQNEMGATLVGIDPDKENEVTQLADRIIEGSYLSPDDEDQVIMGSRLLAKYFPSVPGERTLKDVEIGSKIRLKIGETFKTVTVKGILNSKIQAVGQRIYMNHRELRALLGRTDYNFDEMAIKLKNPENVDDFVMRLRTYDSTREALVQTWEQSQGTFFRDIANTFQLLGDMVGTIGIVVASITVFIVIFINAITRRKYIGILKGIGIDGLAIEISYIIQSFFYAVIGSAVGLFILYGLIKPYIDVHPINFPFSDGLLVAPLDTVILRILILIFATLIAGYIPARIVVKGNTLDAILGR